MELMSSLVRLSDGLVSLKMLMKKMSSISIIPLMNQ